MGYKMTQIKIMRLKHNNQEIKSYNYETNEAKCHYLKKVKLMRF